MRFLSSQEHNDNDGLILLEKRVKVIESYYVKNLDEKKSKVIGDEFGVEFDGIFAELEGYIAELVLDMMLLPPDAGKERRSVCCNAYISAQIIRADMLACEGKLELALDAIGLALKKAEAFVASSALDYRNLGRLHHRKFKLLQLQQNFRFKSAVKQPDSGDIFSIFFDAQKYYESAAKIKMSEQFSYLLISDQIDLCLDLFYEYGSTSVFSHVIINEIIPLADQLIQLNHDHDNLYYQLSLAYGRLGFLPLYTYVNQFNNTEKEPPFLLNEYTQFSDFITDMRENYLALRKLFFPEGRQFNGSQRHDVKKFDDSMFYVLPSHLSSRRLLLRFSSKEKEHFLIEKRFIGQSAQENVQREFELLKGLQECKCYSGLKYYAELKYLMNTSIFLVYHGRTLQDILQLKKTFPLKEIQKMALQILYGLKYLHKVLEFSNLNLNPNELLVDREGNVKIAGAECARKIGGLLYEPIGDVTMQAPEVAALALRDGRSVKVSPAQDLFSFAKLIFLLLWHPNKPDVEFNNDKGRIVFPDFGHNLSSLYGHILWSCRSRHPENRASCCFLQVASVNDEPNEDIFLPYSHILTYKENEFGRC